MVETSIGRDALPTRAVVRLERIVRRAVGSVAVIAPLHMGVVIAVVNTMVNTILVDDGAGNQRACNEGASREPEIAVAAIAPMIFAVTAMAIPVNDAVAAREIAVAVEVAMPHPRLVVDLLKIR